MRFAAALMLAAVTWSACSSAQDAPAGAASGNATVSGDVPGWARDMIWYQIFPERFRNGDAANDPVRASLPNADRVPTTWKTSRWTSDWYERDDWEKEMSPDFNRTVRQRRYGGDLQGVIDRLPYLEQLGVTAIYFNPLFWARSEHKYDGTLFHHIDPYFGPDPAGDLALIASESIEADRWVWTAADKQFLTLVREAHARGLRVIIDGVFNHVGRDFPAFADLRKNGEASAYRDWFKVLSWDDPATEENEFDYEGWWGGKSLPEFADTPDSLDLAPGPKQYVFAATSRWLDPDGDGDPTDGVDGWRLDVAVDVPVGFWADWNRHVRSLNPAAYTVAEIWGDAAKFVAEGGFSASMNYKGFAFPVKGFLIDGRMPATDFGRTLEADRAVFAPAVAFAMQNLIDSHDTERLASIIVNASRRLPYEREDSLVWFDYDWGRHAGPVQDPGYLLRPPDAEERAIQRLVALFQMTYVGAPMIYYGTETGMWGADDPDDRGPMLWEDLAYDDRRVGPRGEPLGPWSYRFEPELHEWYRSVIGLRRSHAALRQGEFDVLLADDNGRTFVFARTLEEERLIVLLHPGDGADTVRLSLDSLQLGEGEGLYPIFSTTRSVVGLELAAEGSDMVIPLQAREGLVLIRTGIE